MILCVGPCIDQGNITPLLFIPFDPKRINNFRIRRVGQNIFSGNKSLPRLIYSLLIRLDRHW